MRPSACFVKISALLAVVVSLVPLHAAYAYGPEGLFGGRPQPDSTIVLNGQNTDATQPEREVSVIDRPRPDYDPAPISYGSFDFFPSLELGGSYDSNIYATRNNPTSDFIGDARPLISGFSDWGRHSLSFTAFGDLNGYKNHGTENFDTAVVQAEGRYDIASETWLKARGGFQYLEEPRTTPNATGGSEPSTFQLYQAGLSGYRGVGLVHAGLDYDANRYVYNTISSPIGSISQTNRDRIQNNFAGKVSYEVSKNFQPYVKISGNLRDYDSNASRTSKGYDAVTGATLDLGGITTFDAYIGWLSQDYSNFVGGKTNAGVDFGGRVNWNVTGMTSVALEVNRSVEETNIATFDSYMATGGSITVTHELLRNLLIEADASYTSDDFQGTATRHDNVLGAEAGTRWLINRNLYTDFTYNWNDRISSVPGIDYSQHIVTLRLGSRL